MVISKIFFIQIKITKDIIISWLILREMKKGVDELSPLFSDEIHLRASIYYECKGNYAKWLFSLETNIWL